MDGGVAPQGPMADDLLGAHGALGGRNLKGFDGQNGDDQDGRGRAEQHVRQQVGHCETDGWDIPQRYSRRVENQYPKNFGGNESRISKRQRNGFTGFFRSDSKFTSRVRRVRRMGIQRVRVPVIPNGPGNGPRTRGTGELIWVVRKFKEMLNTEEIGNWYWILEIREMCPGF